MSASTIFNLATSPGRAGIAIIRLSGPRSLSTLKILTGSTPPKPRQMSMRRIVDPRSNSLIDHAPVVWWKAPHSFTGEDVAEFHVHGGKAITSALLTALGAIDGLRPSEHGEFTYRAVLSGRMSVMEAESMDDLINAETEHQRMSALTAMDGALSEITSAWHEGLAQMESRVTALLEFAEHEQLDGLSIPGIGPLCDQVSDHLKRMAANVPREGLKVVITGPPNVGKSSLFNAIVGRPAAIVSPMAGTTRDVVQAPFDINGVPVLLQDTAGIEDAPADDAQAEGMRRAEEAAKHADVCVRLIDAASHVPSRNEDVLVLTKGDLVPASVLSRLSKDHLVTSSLSGMGIEQLIQALSDAVAKRFEQGPALFTRERHRAHLEQMQASLQRAQEHEFDLELAAEDIRMARIALERLTGQSMSTEELLGKVFSDFCIGK